ncbi:MAG: PocR ligand-binding domain-containing protein [Verrucomicrobiota bacterium]
MVKTDSVSALSQTVRYSGKAAGMFFRQLLGSPEFTQFALILKRLTGLSMALNTPDVGTTGLGLSGDMGNPLCKMIRDTPEGARRCEGCDRRHQAQAGADGKSRLYTCHAGFLDMAIPIMVQGKHVATISSGQVLSEQPSDAAFHRLCRRLTWLGIPERHLRIAYAQAPWMPRNHLTSVMRLLEIFSRQLCGNAWRIRELEACLERPQIRKARAVVEERFRESDLRLSDAATAAGISVAHFSHVFHKETGVPFTSYVQSRRIEEAKRLLAETDQTITEICFECGFNSLTHFNRVFRRGEGCSPRQYRMAPGPLRASSLANNIFTY